LKIGLNFDFATTMFKKLWCLLE